MNATLHFTATVQPGNRVEIPGDQLPVGQVVDVIVMSKPTEEKKESIVDFIMKHRGPLRSSTSWDEMEREFQAERDAWDN